MTDCYEQDDTMFQKLLRQLYDDGILNVPQMANLTGIDDSTIHRWMGGNREPSFTKFKQMFLAGTVDMQRPMLNLLTYGTPWTCHYTIDVTRLDVDGNGKIDAHDALASLSQAVIDTGADVGVVNQAMQDGRISDDEQIRIDRQIDETIEKLITAKAIIAHMHRTQSVRQPAMRSGGAA